ncbi:MAG TPA: alpha/beta hydrolase [Thermoleophilaceae bacterium]|nr:alpha/beta hydrolase [Thermoleophilaceae bacterium]
MADPRTRQLRFQGHRLVFDEYGEGNRTVLLLPPLLFSRRIHRPLAEALADRGHRVLCLDLLGHGDSDRPPEMSNYSMTIFGGQGVALLDHLDISRAVVGGPSLGANASLEVAAAAPDRVRGLMIQMPVLDNALLGCALAFTPMLMGLTFGAPVARLVGRAANVVPRGTTHLADSLLDWIGQDPKPSASVLQGLFFGRVAPPADERRRMRQPTLVIGHRRDPVHPFSDSDMLVRELPNARLIEADSIWELWTSPERLTGKIVPFIEQCFRSRQSGASRRSPARGTSRGQAARRRST